VTELVWGPVHQEMIEVLSEVPVDVPGVVSMQTKLQDLLERATPLDDDNPVADFNWLYLTITEEILSRLQTGYFADPEFLSLLDVEFAKRYFDALRRWSDASVATPEAWKVLFRRLRDLDVRSLPAAAAGVNAHVNYDLPFALVNTWNRLDSGPENRRQHRDYLLINEIFFAKIPELRRGYLATWQLLVDRLNGHLDDWCQNSVIEAARNLAWQDGERLWALRTEPQSFEVRSALATTRRSSAGRCSPRPAASCSDEPQPHAGTRTASTTVSGWLTRSRC
jgi:hypothetical protein